MSILALTLALSLLPAGSALAQSDDPSLPPSLLPAPAASTAPSTPAGSSALAFALADPWVMGQERGWRRLDDPRPAARRLYAVTEAGANAYIFGGVGADGRALDDLWRVDRGTLRFEPVAVEGRLPPARYAGTLIADTQGDRLLLFGGQGDVAKADVWELIDAGPATDQPQALEPAASAVP